MKRLFLIILLLMCLTGCEEESIEYVQVDYAITFNLVSDPQTNIVYIKNNTYGDNPIYTPYYSKNGKLCKYVDGEIKEIDNEY